MEMKMTKIKFNQVVSLTPKMYATFKIMDVPAWAKVYGVKEGMIAYYIESKDTLALLKKNGVAFPIGLPPSYLQFHEYMTAEALSHHRVDIA